MSFGRIRRLAFIVVAVSLVLTAPAAASEPSSPASPISPLSTGVPVPAQNLPGLSQAGADRITLDLEGLDDLEAVTNQFARFGVGFVGATILGQGASLNYLHFPPRSGVNVIYDDPDQSGRIVASFDPGTARNVTVVGDYVTGNRDVSMTAYDVEGNHLGSVSTGGLNHAPYGTPNRLLQFTAPRAIAKIVFFNGGERGNTYTVDDFFFESSLVCRVGDVPPYKQSGSATWAGDLYGGSEAQPWYDYGDHKALFRDHGCATTSAAMIISYYGNLQGKATATPGELNTWLRRNHGYTGGSIYWEKVAEFARDVKGIGLYYYDGWGPDNGIVNAYVCNGAPIVLYMKSSQYNRGHYVVGTGVSDSTGWTVNDPGGYNITSLPAGSYLSHRKYGTERKELHHLTIMIHPPNAPLAASSSVSANASAPVSIVVTDPAGRELVYDAIGDSYQNQILDAGFGRESLGSQDGSGRSVEAYVFATGAPLDGDYQVHITSHISGYYQISMLGYDSGGESSLAELAGNALSGDDIGLGVRYDSAGGSVLEVTVDWQEPPWVYVPLISSSR